MPQSELPSELSGKLNVEHGQINSARLRQGSYRLSSRKFLDTIEDYYLGKLSSGQISVAYFHQAMDDYVRSHQSGSRGELRQREAKHIIEHVQAKLDHTMRG